MRYEKKVSGRPNNEQANEMMPSLVPMRPVLFWLKTVREPEAPNPRHAQIGHRTGDGQPTPSQDFQ